MPPKRARAKSPFANHTPKKQRNSTTPRKTKSPSVIEISSDDDSVSFPKKRKSPLRKSKSPLKVDLSDKEEKKKSPSPSRRSGRKSSGKKQTPPKKGSFRKAPTKISKGPKTLDDLQDELNKFLKGFNLKLQRVDGDGNCFFHSILHQIKTHNFPDHQRYTKMNHIQLREALCNYIFHINNDMKCTDDFDLATAILNLAQSYNYKTILKQNTYPPIPYEITKDYANLMQENGVFADEVAVIAMSSMLKVQIQLYSLGNKNGFNTVVCGNIPDDRVFKIALFEDKHFDSTLPL